MHVHHDVAVAQSESGSINTVSPCDDVSLALQKTRPEATTEHEHEHDMSTSTNTNTSMNTNAHTA